MTSTETTNSTGTGEPGPGESSTGAPATGETTPTPNDMPPTTGQATGAESHADGSTGTGEGEETTPGTGEPADDGSAGKGEGGKTAALKAARQEARQAQAALTATRKAFAESLATALYVPGDLWMDGVKVDQVLDDQGNVDRDKVRALQSAQLGKRPGIGNPRHGQHGAGGNATEDRWRGSSNIGSWSGAAKATKNQGYDSKM